MDDMLRIDQRTTQRWKMNSDADGVVKPIKQLIEQSLGKVTCFQLRPRTLDKQLENTHTHRSH